jgi:hypothetical protein
VTTVKNWYDKKNLEDRRFIRRVCNFDDENFPVDLRRTHVVGLLNDAAGIVCTGKLPDAATRARIRAIIDPVRRLLEETPRTPA